MLHSNRMAQSSVIGIDIGGTKTFVARYDARSFTCQQEERISTKDIGALPAVIEETARIVEKMKTADTIGVGVGIAGLVRQPEGVLLRAPNIPESENVAVRDILQRRLGLPVAVDNDANCFALAEAVQGAGRGKRIVVGITIGTGVGGGIIFDGKVFQGSRGFAGEIGHMLLVPGQPPAGTPNPRGEVEQFLSGTAMGQRCTAAKHPEDYLQGEVCAFMQPSVFRETAWLCTSLTHLLDPDIIVFGGSTGTALGPHLPKIREELNEWMLPGTPLPELAIASIKHAGVVGAALLAR